MKKCCKNKDEYEWEEIDGLENLIWNKRWGNMKCSNNSKFVDSNLIIWININPQSIIIIINLITFLQLHPHSHYSSYIILLLSLKHPSY
jgi:hypothetical protein